MYFLGPHQPHSLGYRRGPLGIIRPIWPQGSTWGGTTEEQGAGQVGSWVSKLSLVLTCRAGALSSRGQGAAGVQGRWGGAGSSTHPCGDIKGSLLDHQCRVSQASLVTRAGHSDAGDTLGSQGLVFGPAHQRSQGGLSARVVESANCCPLSPGPGLPPP